MPTVFPEGGWACIGQAKGMKMRKGNGNTTKLLFSLKGLAILHQERRKMNTTVIEHLNCILFPKSRPANKQHTYQSMWFFMYLKNNNIA